MAHNSINFVKFLAHSARWWSTAAGTLSKSDSSDDHATITKAQALDRIVWVGAGLSGDGLAALLAVANILEENDDDETRDKTRKLGAAH